MSAWARGLIIGGLCAIGACASAPRVYPVLDSAKAAVRSAEADPNVPQFSALDLEAAKHELDIAETAALNHRDQDVAQPAYLAAQTARLAQLRAAAKVDDARIANNQAERDRIELEARTHEAAAARASAELAAAQNTHLRSEIDRLTNAQATERGTVVTLSDASFNPGQTSLSPSGKSRLDELSRYLAAHPKARVTIEGFTDDLGTFERNVDVSRGRAEAVEAALRTRGIDGSRILTAGYGSAYPFVPNADESSRRLNRRVEIIVGADDGSFIPARTR